MFNRKNVYVTGLGIFVIGAALASLANSIPLLIGFKILQGVGSAMVQGNGMATTLSIFPGNERGKALGLNIGVVGTGGIVGPALGGTLVSALDWRAVFYVAVIVGLVAMVAAALILDPRRLQPQDEGGPRKFDWLGAGLSGGALLLFLLVMTNGHQAGWTSPMIALGVLGVVVLLASFIWWELRVPSPMLEIRLFKRKLVALGVATGWLSFLGSSSVIFMMPFYLQKVQGYGPREAGLIIIPGAVMLAIVGAISGRLSDKYGWRRFNMAGLTLASIALFILATRLTETSPLYLIIPLLMMLSSGTGMFNSPNNSSILSAVERSRYGVISALTQLTRNSANVTSIAVATAIVAATMASSGFEPSLDAVSDGAAGVSDAFVDGLHNVFLVFGSLLALGVVISFFKGDRIQEPEGEQTAGTTAEQARGHS